MTTFLHALFAACLLLPPPAPDIIPDGMRGIRIESTIDAKALAATCCLAHVVQKGDTLSSIARAHYGDLAQVAAIEKLNPLVMPDRLRIGEVIWLPPTDPAAAAKEPVFVYLDTQRPLYRDAKPLVDGAAVNPSRYGGIGLFLVPLTAREAFRTAIATSNESRRGATQDALAALVTAGKVVDIDGKAPGSLVPQQDPTDRRVDTYTVVKQADGTFTLRVTSVAYDKAGKALDAKGTGSGKPAKEGLVLLLLGAAGSAILMFRARGRRTPALV